MAGNTKYWVEFRDPNHNVSWREEASSEEALQLIIDELPPDYAVKARGSITTSS